MKNKPKSNLVTNTGHRFISMAKTAYKIHVHMPDDTVLHRSVGHVRMGKKRALKKAIKMRNEIGYQAWGKHWKKLLKDPYLLTRLPHSVEPKIIFKPRKLKSGTRKDECYIAVHRSYDESGKQIYKSLVRSIESHGRLTAYLQCKKAMLEWHKDDIEILKHMNRITTIGLK